MTDFAAYHDPSEPPRWLALFCLCPCHNERTPVRPCGCCSVGMEGVLAEEASEVEAAVRRAMADETAEAEAAIKAALSVVVGLYGANVDHPAVDHLESALTAVKTLRPAYDYDHAVGAWRPRLRREVAARDDG